MGIGDRVRAAREAREMRQDALAEAIGLTADKISKVEAGTRKLSGVELGLAARALGVRVDDLLYERPLVSRRGDGDNPSARRSLAQFEAFIADWRTFRDLASLR